MYYVATKGPISVGVNPKPDAWKYYKKGLLPDGCGQRLTHWVLLVGYGSDATNGDYWLIKNSWGSRWGLDGFAWIKRSGQDVCGIFDYPLIATVK